MSGNVCDVGAGWCTSFIALSNTNRFINTLEEGQAWMMGSGLWKQGCYTILNSINYDSGVDAIYGHCNNLTVRVGTCSRGV